MIRILFNSALICILGCLTLTAHSHSQSLDTNGIGTLITQTVAREQDPDLFVEGSPQLFLARQPERLQDVAQYGFASLLETIAAGGNSSLFKRHSELTPLKSIWESLGFKTPPWNPTALYPKSAFLVLESPTTERFIKRYGTLFFKLSDSVLERTTWTRGDSITVGDYKRLGPSGTTPERTLLEPSYYEAQIWGALSFRDVEAIYILEEDFKRQRDSLMRIRNEYGVAIYTYEWNPIYVGGAYQSMQNIKLKADRKESDRLPPTLNSAQLIKRYQELEDLSADKEKNVILTRLGEISDKEAIDFLTSLYKKLPLHLKKISIQNLILEASGDGTPKYSRALIIRKALSYAEDLSIFLRTIFLNETSPLKLRAKILAEMHRLNKINQQTQNTAKTLFEHIDFRSELMSLVNQEAYQEISKSVLGESLPYTGGSCIQLLGIGI